LKPISKGTKLSSSIQENALTNTMNSRSSSGDRFHFTSSNTVRGTRITCIGFASSNFSSSLTEAAAFNVPKANMYSLESMTSRKFLFPYFFSRLSKLLDNFFFAHLKNRGRVSCDHFPELLKMFLCFGFLSFHRSSPLIKFTMKSGYCQTFVLLLLMTAACAPFAYADTTFTFQYDANGNLISGDGKYYEYNDANQLVQVRQGDTIAGPVIAEYFYDASRQCVKKIENGVVTEC
jgi:hypothetical protein